MPFPDDSVDLVWCERVLQHLPDAQTAITDIARVLRPGGRAVLLDSDHATRVSSDVAPEIEARINADFIRHVPNARAARQIPRQVAAAGLDLDDDIGSAALIMSPEQLRQAPWLAMGVQRAVEDGTLAEARRGPKPYASTARRSSAATPSPQ